jgi:periplasmic divalent cation tolerance protein
MIVVMTTLPNAAEAEKFAHDVVGENLAACVQILSPMRSVYRWEGKVESADEVLLLIKTPVEKFAELEKFITANHPYDVPEIVAINAADVSEPYRKWLEAETA